MIAFLLLNQTSLNSTWSSSLIILCFRRRLLSSIHPTYHIHTYIDQNDRLYCPTVLVAGYLIKSYYYSTYEFVITIHSFQLIALTERRSHSACSQIIRSKVFKYSTPIVASLTSDQSWVVQKCLCGRA
jgi:hypothetical protein